MKRIQLSVLLATVFMFVGINLQAQNTKKVLKNEKQRKEVMAAIANNPAMRMEMMDLMKMKGEKMHDNHMNCKMHGEKMQMKGDMECTKACCSEMSKEMKEQHKEEMKERKEEMKERKEDLKDQKEDINDNIKDLKDDIEDDVEDIKDDMEKEMKDRKKKKDN